MALIRIIAFLLVFPLLHFAEISEITTKLNKVVDFALNHYEEINFDGLLGFIIAEAQLLQASRSVSDHYLASTLEVLVKKCEKIREKIIPLLPRSPRKMIIMENALLHPEKWITNKPFIANSLKNSGIYRNWTVDYITRDKHAYYKGVPSDHCLMEILAKNCYVSRFCEEMMLAPRRDKGYLLTHRLLYLQIVRLKQCHFDEHKFELFTKKFCLWILKETRTNEHLGFPAHDIALEQIVLCGIEGYAEFLNEKWRKKVLSWQTPYGCFKSEEELHSKRSSNVVSFGCTDHSTGLGAAALALNLRFAVDQNSLV